MEKITIDIPQSRFMKLETMVQELLENSKNRVQPEQVKEVFTPQDFCDYFKCSISTFNRLKKKHQIKCSKINRRVYINKSEIDRLINEGI